MKTIFVNILAIIWFSSFAIANNNDINDSSFPECEQELTIELDHKEPLPTTQLQRETRFQQKQEIKSKILELYQELKEEKIRWAKKDTRHQISELKRQLRTINSKIAYSYKKQFKNFFGLNK